jgi:hypothetical protein
MKKICIMAVTILLVGLVAKPSLVVAQADEEDLAAFLEASEADASKLISAYLQPVVRSLSYSMTGGWYTTAKAHSSLGFDLSISVNAAFIPTAENFFDPNKLGLSSTVYVGGRPDGSALPFDPTRKAPTIFGPKDDTQYQTTYDPDGAGPIPAQTNTFAGPEGFDIKKEIGIAAIPTPMIQLGVGIIKNTDIKVRFIPEQEAGSSKIKMFGIGVLHDIKQHIAGIKLLPFDLAALVAYNSVTGSTDLSNDGSGGVPASPNGVGDYKFNSWVFQALISKKISVLTGYAGIGYNMVNTNVDVKGDYTIVSDGSYSYVVNDPVAIDFKNKSMRLTLGMRLKLGPIFFNGDYTFQKYNTLSVGFGVAVR